MPLFSDQPIDDPGETGYVVRFATAEELQWALTAVEGEMARRGKLVEADPVLHITILTHLAGAYERLRRASS